MSLEEAVASLRRELEAVHERLDSIASRLPSRLLTVEDAAKELGVCVETVRRRARAGELASRRVGRHWRIDLDASRPLVSR